MTLVRQTVAALAGGSLAAVRVLERHGIDYCGCDDLTLEQACETLHVDANDVLLEIDQAAAATTPERNWSATPLRELMDHIVREDHAFIRAELPLLEERLRRVVETYSETNPTLAHLPLVFRNLRNELESHMDGEERELFPAIERYLSAIEEGKPLKGSPLAAFGGPLHLMEQEHESVSAALRLLREFCQNYNIPKRSCLRYRALVDGLTDLEDRLARHMYLENTVLYPRAAALKSSRRWQETPTSTL